MIFTFSVKQHLQKISESRSWADLLVMEEDGETVYSSFEQKEDKWRQEQSDELVKEAAGKYQVCVLMDQEMLLQRLFPKILAIVAVAILVLGTSILCIAVYIRRLTGRVDVILNGMEEVETGNLQVRLDINRSGGDELDTIADHFNDMCAKLEEYIQKSYTAEIEKKNAQMQALQSQINPHFLYNTLESIRSEALIAGLVSVADMTEALATFFRYTISKVENLVSVEEELQNCMTYFKIQQYRFGDRLQLSVECDPEEKAAIYSCRIPKLTLQPILENSIIHGTECKLGTGHIRILLEMTESCLLLCISDDGNGMEERKVADINERLQKSGGILATGESETKGGIALVNVNNRIHLLFGEEYGIHVYSMPEIGTDVKIRIPVIYSDRNLIHMEERQENYC